MKRHKWACDFCGEEYIDESPPPREQYEMGRIELRDSTMLLPSGVVNARRRDGRADSHATSLDGQYCNIDCLKANIEAILAEATRGVEGGPDCCQ